MSVQQTSGPAIFTPEYYDRLRSLEAAGWWNAAMRDILARGIARLWLPRSGFLLDVGCGTGATMDWFLRRHPAWRALGIDVAWDGLRAVPRTPAGAAAQASALALPLRTGTADLVIAQDVLQHLPLAGGDETALGEIRRVLKPGGALFLRTNAQSVPRTMDDEEFQFHRYDTRELRGKLKAAGFSVERLARVNAMLGLLEIPRELKARRRAGGSYHGILATPRRSGLDGVKRWWLSAEARVALAGVPLPLGRTHIAICRASDAS